MNTLVDLWKLVLDDLEKELSAISIMTWFDEVVPVKMEVATLCLYCPNKFKRSSIERFYLEPIQKSLRCRFGCDIQIRFLSDEEFAESERICGRRKSFDSSGKFTFENFVVGESNQLAYRAAQMVAAGFDEYCNPLILYGDPGLGKTHLLHAIASAVSKSDPDAEIVCLKGDEFTNEMIEAIRTGSNVEFREKHRNAAVFLMDDVQFIAGKKQTQEEFFHTFDALCRNGCSIVLTMDRCPRELHTLEKRLVSRFEGGLTVKISEPEHDTRLEIVRRKAVERGLDLQPEEVEYVASMVEGSIRRLEGVLNQLKIFGTEGNVEEKLREIIQSTGAPAVLKRTPEEVIDAVARCYGVEANLVKGKARTKNITAARQMAVYLMGHELGLSTTRIGTILSRDHSTVCYALRRMEERLVADPVLGEKMEQIIKELGL